MTKIAMKIKGTPEKMAKELRPIIKEALFTLINDWHKNTMPKHFTLEAKEKYGITPRSKGYMIKKARIKHHQKPLVFSGESERRIKRMVRVTGTYKKARGAFDAPRYFWMTPSGHPEKNKELLRLPSFEKEEMNQRLHDIVTEKLNKINDVKVVQ